MWCELALVARPGRGMLAITAWIRARAACRLPSLGIAIAVSDTCHRSTLPFDICQ
jgi:hypothetical protein